MTDAPFKPDIIWFIHWTLIHFQAWGHWRMKSKVDARSQKCRKFATLSMPCNLSVTHAILTAPNPTLIWKIMLYSERTFFFVHFEGESSISTYNIFFETIIFRETAPTPPTRHFGTASIASCLRFNSQLLCTWCRESDVILIKNGPGRNFVIHMDKIQIGCN